MKGAPPEEDLEIELVLIRTGVRVPSPNLVRTAGQRTPTRPATPDQQDKITQRARLTTQADPRIVANSDPAGLPGPRAFRTNNNRRVFTFGVVMSDYLVCTIANQRQAELAAEARQRALVRTARRERRQRREGVGSAAMPDKVTAVLRAFAGRITLATRSG
ncbi:hypothetical protein ACTWPT_41260 [Nonomuraea sp. 3N208]|uniref:hypothetical protein n=1 Tax=Nonomuraea sp. 3N208 TaxID=3457421 RepID=UPI003FD0F159